MKVALSASTIITGDRKATVIIIKLGTLCLANAKIGGRWSAEQAIAEVKRNPKRFKFTHDDAAVILRSQGCAI